MIPKDRRANGRRKTPIRVVALCLSGSAVSAQIPDGYLASERPDPKGTPTKIELGLYLLDLAAVDDLKQEFSVDLLINATWRDPRLAIDAPGSIGAARILPRSAVWDPAVGALNRPFHNTGAFR